MSPEPQRSRAVIADRLMAGALVVDAIGAAIVVATNTPPSVWASLGFVGAYAAALVSGILWRAPLTTWTSGASLVLWAIAAFMGVGR
jgi:hypothetical protein